ncbi:MAG: signal recognition particle subunit SRP19/SEC65 family protein [Desulfurococcaceae archaeon]
MSREYRDHRIVIYPIYFDRGASRKKGRRVPLKIAVNNPTLEKIMEACNRLGLNPRIEPDKTYPRSFIPKGRIIIDKHGSKLRTIYLIASVLREIEK